MDCLKARIVMVHIFIFVYMYRFVFSWESEELYDLVLIFDVVMVRLFLTFDLYTSRL